MVIYHTHVFAPFEKEPAYALADKNQQLKRGILNDSSEAP